MAVFQHNINFTINKKIMSQNFNRTQTTININEIIPSRNNKSSLCVPSIKTFIITS